MVATLRWGFVVAEKAEILFHVERQVRLKKVDD
jgi:hypothetical protein